MTRLRRASLALACAALCLCAATAAAASGRPSVHTLRPRIGGAMGIVPPAGRQGIAVGSNLPEVYHGGSVMRDVTIHTIFWAPSGFSFDGPPPGATLGYQALVQQFFADVAHDSGQSSNVFSLINQYGDQRAPGSYRFAYSAGADSISDTSAYPRRRHQCASPASIETCVTDFELRHEIQSVMSAHGPGAGGLDNLWFVFLPPNVDTCITPGACGSNTFGGYHSLSGDGHGFTIYAVIPDPLIQATLAPGSDPQGNPDAEGAIDVAAHEAVEAVTDPKGDGWMDPNGNEVGDKCQNGPQVGTPLGFAPDGSPFDQVIGEHQYLLQTQWSNQRSGCVQRSSATASTLPIPQIRLSQFSSRVSGSLGVARAGVRVRVALVRAGSTVARARATTSPGGGWGPVSLRSHSRGPLSRVPHAVGDDRDRIEIDYSAGGPRSDVILTGDGGNPFAGGGWTGWFDLDNGFAVTSSARRGAIALEPCSQTGVLRLSVDHVALRPPTERCATDSDVSTAQTGPLGARAVLTMGSNDDRAVTPANPNGALVSLAIRLGEPNSVSALGNDQVLTQPTGFPLCSGDLQAARVRCTGLVPGAGYALARARGDSVVHARANGNGSIAAAGFSRSPGLMGGDLIRLRNGAGRTLTSLHLAHLRVDVDANSSVIASGTCEPGDYYGPALSKPPVSGAVDEGVAGTGTVCPSSGRAAGLSSTGITQTDDRSGGQTHTEVPMIEDTSPTQDETVYGGFRALAGAGLPGPHGVTIPSAARVALTITHAGAVVFQAANVNTANGVPVRPLPAGLYDARWVLIDANGDTRTVKMRFFAG